MQVILAESAGFCYGVKRAVELAQKTAEETQGCWMLGDLIHNTHVVNDLAARGVRCVNATCPNVVHIQELVSQAEQEGRQVVIIGEPHHPEVMGLASWCVHPLVFQGPEAVAEWVKNGDFQPEMPVSIVAQTTCIRELFESSCKIRGGKLVRPFDGKDMRTVLPADLCQMLRIGALTVANHHHHVYLRSDLRRFVLTFTRSITYCIKDFYVCTFFF